MSGPGDGQALSGAAEVRRDLLGPLERRVEGPGPRYRHMRLSLVRTPVVVILQLLCDWNINGFNSSGTGSVSCNSAFVLHLCRFLNQEELMEREAMVQNP